MGRRHRPFFRICAMDSRTGRDGRPIEELGHYDPMCAECRDPNGAERQPDPLLAVGRGPAFAQGAGALEQAGVKKPAPGEPWQVAETPPTPAAPRPPAQPPPTTRSDRKAAADHS